MCVIIYNMSSNEYMRKYMIRRYRIRRKIAIDLLGGKCAICKSIKLLEFDHKKPNTKNFTIAKASSVNNKNFWEEIKKCQLLCKTCHKLKTLKDLGQKNAKLTHGTLSSYRYCKCVLCRKANNDWWNKTYKRKTINGKRITIRKDV
uniref:Putative HNH endonuclease n=1 Tax=viral metagenome TaxID=1070528 RepID=A0A6M3IFE9_9ZZZZ